MGKWVVDSGARCVRLFIPKRQEAQKLTVVEQHIPRGVADIWHSACTALTEVQETSRAAAFVANSTIRASLPSRHGRVGGCPVTPPASSAPPSQKLLAVDLLYRSPGNEEPRTAAGHLLPPAQQTQCSEALRKLLLFQTACTWSFNFFSCSAFQPGLTDISPYSAVSSPETRGIRDDSDLFLPASGGATRLLLLDNKASGRRGPSTAVRAARPTHDERGARGAIFTSGGVRSIAARARGVADELPTCRLLKPTRNRTGSIPHPVPGIKDSMAGEVVGLSTHTCRLAWHKFRRQIQ